MAPKWHQKNKKAPTHGAFRIAAPLPRPAPATCRRICDIRPAGTVVGVWRFARWNLVAPTGVSSFLRLCPGYIHRCLAENVIFPLLAHPTHKYFCDICRDFRLPAGQYCFIFPCNSFLPRLPTLYRIL